VVESLAAAGTDAGATASGRVRRHGPPKKQVATPKTTMQTAVTPIHTCQFVAATTCGATRSTTTAMPFTRKENRPHAVPCNRGSMFSASSEKFAIQGE